ncbi:MAG: TolC family protein, partial [bacterium]
ELLEKRVELEVRQAYETYQLYHQQVEQFLDQSVPPPEQLLEIAQFSYAEGEMSLLELLDGVRAYSESFQARNDLLLKYQLSIFELEKATAKSTTDF